MQKLTKPEVERAITIVQHLGRDQASKLMNCDPRTISKAVLWWEPVSNLTIFAIRAYLDRTKPV